MLSHPLAYGSGSRVGVEFERSRIEAFHFNRLVRQALAGSGDNQTPQLVLDYGTDAVAVVCGEAVEHKLFNMKFNRGRWERTE
jgi:hypothetical protein